MKTWIIILIVALVLVGIYLYKKGKLSNIVPSVGGGLASCIKNSGAKFYGASWCPHCNDQKHLFGKDEKYLPYIECSTPSGGMNKVCVDAGVDGYPMWVFKDGKKVSGGLSIEQLKKETGC